MIPIFVVNIQLTPVFRNKSATLAMGFRIGNPTLLAFAACSAFTPVTRTRSIPRTMSLHTTKIATTATRTVRWTPIHKVLIHTTPKTKPPNPDGTSIKTQAASNRFPG